MRAIADSLRLGSELDAIAKQRDPFVRSDAGCETTVQSDSLPGDRGRGRLLDIERSSDAPYQEANGSRFNGSDGRGEEGDARAVVDTKIKIAQATVFRGAFELLNAAWSLDSGRTVEFRLIEKPGEDQVNPFKQYQKRRNGKVGQTFIATIVQDGHSVAVYSGAVMLCAWADSSTKGLSVKFWLDDEASHHPFAGYSRRTADKLGDHFAAVICLATDDGAAIDGIEHKEPKRRPFSSSVHLMVTSDKFVQWLNEKSEYTAALHKKGRRWDGQEAKRYVKWKLGVESLADLDTHPDKAKRFHEEIRKPFLKFTGRD